MMAGFFKSLHPYRKAIAAGICSAVVVAAGYYDVAWLQVASAAVTPIVVFLAKNSEA